MRPCGWILAALLSGCAPASSTPRPAQPEPPALAQAVAEPESSAVELDPIDPVTLEHRTHRPSPEAQANENRQRCDQGDPTACHAAALDAYYATPSSPRTDRLAHERFTRACDGGHPPSCSGLGVMIMQGRAGPVDTARALRLFVSACEAGASAGCRQLADAARHGQGLSPDPELVQRAEARQRCAFEASLGKAELASCPALGPVPILETP